MPHPTIELHDQAYYERMGAAVRLLISARGSVREARKYLTWKITNEPIKAREFAFQVNTIAALLTAYELSQGA